MPYSPYIYILLVRLHLCVQNVKAIRKLDDSAFLRTQSQLSPKSVTLNFYEVLNFGQHHIGTFFKRSTYLPQYTYKVDQNQNQVKFRSVRTLLRITHLAHRKTYLVIICPNSHEKLTKSETRSSSSRFEHCSESLIQPIGSHVMVILCPNSHEKLTKSEIR